MLRGEKSIVKYDTPEGWKLIPLKYVVNANKETLPEDTPDDFEFLYVDIGAVVYGKGIKHFQKMLFKDAPSRARRVVHEKDVILSMVRTYLTATAVIPLSNTQIIVSTGFLTLTATNRIVPEFLKYSVQMDSFVSEVESRSVGINYPAINASEAININIMLPPIEKQLYISKYLDKKCSQIDNLISDIQKQIEILEEYKKSVITEAVTKGLNRNVEMKDSGIPWIGKMPLHWNAVKFNTLYTLRTEKVSDRDFPPLSVTKFGIVPQLDTAAKTNDNDNRKLVCKGDFVINSRSDRRGSCGISPYNGSVSLINLVLKPCSSEMNPEYYNWVFHTVAFADEFYKWGHGIVDDLWTSNWQDMKNIILFQPALTEQIKIDTYLSEKCTQIDAILKDKQEQLKKLAEYKKSLIFEYITGKKEVV